MTVREFINNVNAYSATATPFVFIIDFELKKPLVHKLDEAHKAGIYFDIQGHSNLPEVRTNQISKTFSTSPVSRKSYFKSFDLVQKHLKRGDSYLLNLTFPTLLKTTYCLNELFAIAKAPYKCLLDNNFLVYSPECFVKIIGNKIFSYPMKGTIDASLPHARKMLLENKKEIYEHNTIVDLIRNDLSMVATDVNVRRLMFLQQIRTNKADLLQMSSEICGVLENKWRTRLGEILIRILPAGSVSGAPKAKTLEIIRDAEKKDRGYFTGIFGVFDGKNLDSAVNIRYIEKSTNGLQYRSGGGITALSKKEQEYVEMVNKVYIPFS